MANEEEAIEDALAARKERLKALKAAHDLLNTPDDSDTDAHPNNNLGLKFRNYVPQDKQLSEARLDPPVLPKFEDPVAAVPPPSDKEDPFVNIAPKKPNWDLRRDVQKKLDKLERRTQKAIYRIMETEEREQNQETEDVNGN